MLLKTEGPVCGQSVQSSSCNAQVLTRETRTPVSWGAGGLWYTGVLYTHIFFSDH